MDEAMAAFGELPDWFGAIVFVGGSTLIFIFKLFG